MEEWGQGDLDRREKMEKKEILDPEVRGQGSSPDSRSIEGVSARQAST